jgi:hypothetical protein
MLAHRREFWSKNIYAGRGNAGVDPGPTYVSRNINMPARGYRAPAREEYADPKMLMSIWDSRMLARAS